MQDMQHNAAECGSTTTARRRRAKTAAALPPLPVVRVAYRVVLDSGICASLVAHLVQFLLYFRGQIPCVYDELLGVVLAHEQQQAQQRQAGQRKTRLLGGPLKRAIKCISSTERLVHTSLPALFHGHVHAVVLIFGASVFSPREVFVLDVGSRERLGDPSELLSASDAAPLPRPKVLRLCAQKLIRALIANATERFTSGLAVTSLHIAALAPKRAAAITGFVPRQSFRLRLPKPLRSGATRTHHIRICSSPGVGASSHDSQHASPIDVEQQQQMLERDDPNLIWYISDQSIAGFGGAL